MEAGEEVGERLKRNTGHSKSYRGLGIGKEKEHLEASVERGASKRGFEWRAAKRA